MPGMIRSKSNIHSTKLFPGFINIYKEKNIFHEKSIY